MLPQPFRPQNLPLNGAREAAEKATLRGARTRLG
jgi:hypothetical protein